MVWLFCQAESYKAAYADIYFDLVYYERYRQLPITASCLGVVELFTSVRVLGKFPCFQRCKTNLTIINEICQNRNGHIVQNKCRHTLRLLRLEMNGKLMY